MKRTDIVLVAEAHLVRWQAPCTTVTQIARYRNRDGQPEAIALADGTGVRLALEDGKLVVVEDGLTGSLEQLVAFYEER